ncbi:hypothetical protein [Streptomyces sp. G1]|uniref:hypothetical protein n=1 Tax=Streptomyces sp. G1 TaxID=361572 RepID=UPI00202E3278|nr:hypothetical protein [Streptomyces sp. G1]MCM1964841.1 hypothetical protein [Streptomyces sp. G1]
MIVIRVTPAAGLRQAFAAWAVQQRPKVRTVSSRSFAVPPKLFTALPEELLLGSYVDGHPYVPVPPEEEPEAPAVLPERECSGRCTGHLPDLPAEAYPPDAVLLDLVGAEAEPPHPPPADEPDSAPADTDPGTPGTACPEPECGRTFDTARGLATHARAHAKAAS